MRTVCVFALMLHAAVSTVFFHELSSVDLEPGESKDAAFGYSLAYQAGNTPRILIGAPRYDETGRMFQCPMGAVREAKRSVKCEALVIDLDALGVQYSREFSTNQHFYLGASIAATEHFFLTCAPLRTAFLRADRFFGAYGICFIYNETGHVRPWSGPGREQYLEQLLDGERIVWQDKLYGGHGWATLVDEVHGRVLVTKSFTVCDMYVGNITAPYNNFQSLLNHGILDQNDVFKYKNYGQAMTLGNYFDPRKENTLYAINVVYDTAEGGYLLLDSGSLKVVFSYTDSNVGSMFGSALASADATRDARADLLVGAPAHVDDDACWDRGALHVFTATSNGKMEMKLTVRGGRDGARFGTSLTAYDVNGDSYPEIIVGAPGENAVYVLCGYEIYKILTQMGNHLQRDVSDLSNTQRIEQATHKQFGFSSLPIVDLDDNGSRELLLAAPGQSKVTLYRGIPSITVEVTSRVPKIPAGADFKYAISSCVKFLRPQKPKTLKTILWVTNVLNGNDAEFKSGATKDKYGIDISKKGKLLNDGREEYCKELSIKSTTICTVTTKVFLAEDITKIADFSASWVMLSEQSTTEKSLTLSCSCASPEDCKPQLSAQLDWGNRSQSYVVGSSRVEAVNITVHNSGTRACAACAVVRVRGASVAQLRCARAAGDYLCHLPSPFMQDEDELIELKLWMDISNQNRSLNIEVILKENCEESKGMNKSLTVPYVFSEDLVSIQGSAFNYSLSDIELNNEDQPTLTEEQTFSIVTTESVTWENVQATITLEKKPYIQSLQVLVAKPARNCEVAKDDAKFISANCLLTLPPNSTVVITVYTTIIKKEIKNNMKNWEITIPSELNLQLSSDLTKHHTVTTVIMLQKQAIGQNKTLIIIIGVVVGLVLLALLSFILYKVGFFKRKKKEDLQNLKAEFRRRSTIKRDTEGSDRRSHGHSANSQSDMEDLIIVEESPFDDPSPAGPLDCAPAASKKSS